MRHMRLLRLALGATAALLVTTAPSMAAFERDRALIAGELAWAEDLRDCYRICYEATDLSVITRLATGDGRFHHAERFPGGRMPNGLTLPASEEIRTWNGAIFARWQYLLDDPLSPEMLNLWGDRNAFAATNHVDVTLGLQHPHLRAPMRISELVSDPRLEVELADTSFDGMDAVDVIVTIGPDVIPAAPLSRVRFTYVPDRQWMLAAYEDRRYPSVEALRADEPSQHGIHMVTRMQHVDGIWWPTSTAHDMTTYPMSDLASIQRRQAVRRILEVEANPSIDEAVFEVHEQVLPTGSRVADARLNVDYVIGESKVQLEGSAFDVGDPITRVLTPIHLAVLMAHAVPTEKSDVYVLPDDVAVTIYWLRWSMGGLLALSAFVLSYLFVDARRS